MDRRAFLVVLVVALCGCGPSEAPKKSTGASGGAAPVAETPGGRQQVPITAGSLAKIPRVAILVFGAKGAASATAPSAAPTLFRERMTELGYVDGKTVLIEERYAEGDSQRLTQLAHEVVESKPDVIVAIAASATAAAREATSTIPIVMAHAGGMVESGLVASLAHPGGNVTGTSSMVPELGVKQVELLRQLLPNLARLGVLCNPTNTGVGPTLAKVNEAARRLNIGVTVAEVTRSEDFGKALIKLRDAHPDALLVLIEPLIGMHRDELLAFAATNRLPTSYDVGREIVRQGGLISYGPVLSAHYALVADYVDKILKGARPGDLPIQQPTQFSLAINMNTAKALGLAVPQALLARADEVIQ